jgi:7-cyano-7-deazaguanine synthase
MTKCVVLFSGGVDSLACLLWSLETYGADNVTALYCNIGQRYAQKEVSAVRGICKQLNVSLTIETRLTLSDCELPPELNAIIPYRNSFFILLAGLHLPEEGGIVCLQNIIVGETSTWDRRPEFNDAMQNLLNYADPRRVKLKVPHQGKTKTEILSYLKEKVPVEVILQTVGCYTDGEGNCGACNSCFRSFTAMINAGIPAPERRYNQNPLNWEEGIQRYVDRMVRGEYEQSRVDETFRALATVGVLHKYLGKTYAIDLDGVIADTGPEKFNPTMSDEEVVKVYRQAKPNQTIITKINKLYDEGNVIFIHSSRYESDRELTEQWLAKNDVKYHRLILDKLRADYYIDDKNLSLQIFEGGEQKWVTKMCFSKIG